MALHHPKKIIFKLNYTYKLLKITLPDPIFLKNTGKTNEMIRKVGLEADSRLRYAIITIQSISDFYYTALYCPGKHNVLSSPKNSPALLISVAITFFTRHSQIPRLCMTIAFKNRTKMESTNRKGNRQMEVSRPSERPENEFPIG